MTVLDGLLAGLLVDAYMRLWQNSQNNLTRIDYWIRNRRNVRQRLAYAALYGIWRTLGAGGIAAAVKMIFAEKFKRRKNAGRKVST